jgi:hypothetical protein
MIDLNEQKKKKTIVKHAVEDEFKCHLVDFYKNQMVQGVSRKMKFGTAW